MTFALLFILSLTGINLTAGFICGLLFQKTASEVGYDLGVKTRRLLLGK